MGKISFKPKFRPIDDDLLEVAATHQKSQVAYREKYHKNALIL
jgi:hypothetical protein